MDRTICAGAVAVLLLGIAHASPADAATQVGVTFVPEDGCTSNITVVQSGSPGGEYAAPFAGVITSWSFNAGPEGPQVRLKVARFAGGSNFTIVGESALESTAPGPNTFATRVPSVETGDVIGFYIVTGEVSALCTTFPVPTYSAHLLMGDQAPGTTASYDPQASAQLDISAVLEPDCDSDGFGDETQDSNVSSCNPRSLTLDASKNKVEKGKRVRLSGRVAETRQNGTCAANQSVELQRKKPSQSIFTTIEQLQTDAAGAFAAKEKVKKTFEYRVQVPESATCAAGVSNTEKVKVKKK